MLQVPQFDFASLNYVTPLQYFENKNEGTLYKWNGPSQAVRQIALTVMGRGQILPISTPASNATWTLDLWGPALQCNDVAKTERDKTWMNIWNSYNRSESGPYGFLSWVPWSYDDKYLYGAPGPVLQQYGDVDINLPFLLNLTSDLPVVGPPTPSLTANGSASFFIATFPEAQHFSLHMQHENIKGIYDDKAGTGCWLEIMHEITDPGTASCDGQITAAQFYVNSTFLRCDLVNTSYSVDFSYSGGAQDIHISSNMTGNSTIMNSTTDFQGPTLPLDPLLPANCSSFLSYQGPPCVFDLDSIRGLSYQGTMAAFNGLVVGSIQKGEVLVDKDTSVVRTILATTKKLAFLEDWASDTWESTFDDLQTVISNSTGWAYPGLVNSNPSHTNADLKSTLERLFENFTISLLAEPYLQPNYSSPFAPPRLTNVSLPIYHNIYTYDRDTLWIAYGLSIFFTTLAAIAGLIAVLLNGASYSNNFSTIVRVARTADLSTEILDKERDGFGRGPLPKYLKHARLDMSGGTDGVAAAAAAGGADHTDADRLVELVERRPVEDEQSSIVTREMDQLRGDTSTEELQSPFISRRSISIQSMG